MLRIFLIALFSIIVIGCTGQPKQSGVYAILRTRTVTKFGTTILENGFEVKIEDKEKIKEMIDSLKGIEP